MLLDARLLLEKAGCAVEARDKQSRMTASNPARLKICRCFRQRREPEELFPIALRIDLKFSILRRGFDKFVSQG